jgi:hypothetical protein
MTVQNEHYTLKFPQKSRQETDQKFTLDEIREEMDRAIMARAEFLAEILLRLKKIYGDNVIKVATDAIYDIGVRKGKKIASRVPENSIENFPKEFSSRLDGLYWGFFAKKKGDTLDTYLEYCPLARKWQEMGLSDEQIIEFCTMSDAIDKGVIDGYNDKYTAVNSGCRALAETGRCGMIVRRKE